MAFWRKKIFFHPFTGDTRDSDSSSAGRSSRRRWRVLYARIQATSTHAILLPSISGRCGRLHSLAHTPSQAHLPTRFYSPRHIPSWRPMALSGRGTLHGQRRTHPRLFSSKYDSPLGHTKLTSSELAHLVPGFQTSG